MGLEEDLSISPAVSTAIGSLAGVVEVMLQQPLVAWKNALQDMRPVPLDPRLWYRGVLVNAASIAPINGVQFGVNTLLEEAFAARYELTDGARTGIATAAGAVSGLFTGPPELIMIQQQKLGGTLAERLRLVVQEHGLSSLGRGLAPAVVREAIFTGAYLGVIPLMRENLMQKWPETFAERPVTSNVVASVGAGLGAAILTHPFDTVKTKMQANLGEPTYRTMSSTARAMVSEGGAGVLFRGIVPRAQRVTCAVFILGEVKDRVTALYLQARGPSPASQHSSGGGIVRAHHNPAVALAMEGKP